MRHFPILFATMALASGCDKVGLPSKAETIPRGYGLKGLVTATAAPSFDPGSGKVAEVVREHEAWSFYLDGGLLAVPSTTEAFKVARERAALDGMLSRLLVSADAGLRFEELRKLLREAARSGFDRVDFLVRTPGSAGGDQAFRLDFPVAIRCGSPPDIEPKFVKIAADGSVFVGTGASHVRLDAAESDASLPLLNEDLQSFVVAAKAAASPPVLQIHVAGDASYQRWIDVMARCHANGVNHVFVVDVTMEAAATCDGMRTKPSNPGSRSLPVAPARNRLRE